MAHQIPSDEAGLSRFMDAAFDAYEAKCGEEARYEALISLSEVVDAGLERCLTVGCFGVARAACGRRLRAVEAAGAVPLWRARRRAMTLLKGTGIEAAGCCDKAKAHALQARVQAAPQENERAILDEIGAAATAALDAFSEASSVFRGLLAAGDDGEATLRLADCMVRVGETCAAFGGNVDAALPALHEALTAYDRLPHSDTIDEKKAAARLPRVPPGREKKKQNPEF